MSDAPGEKRVTRLGGGLGLMDHDSGFDMPDGTQPPPVPQPVQPPFQEAAPQQPPAGYVPGYAVPGQPAGFGPPGYGPPGYGPPAYGPPAYGPPGYGPPGYAAPGYGPPAYGQQPYGQPGYGPGYYPAPQAPKPGGIPLRPLSVSDILDGAFGVIRRNPAATVGLAACVGAIQAVVSLLYQLGIRSASNPFSFGGSSTTSTNPDEPPDLGPLFASFGSVLVLTVVSMFFSFILTGLLCVAISDDALGKRPSLGEVWDRVKPKLARLVGLSFVVSVVSYAGLALCLAPGIWLWGIWALAVPALVLEDTSIGGALGRSRHLVDGAFWRVWGIRALGWFISRILTTIFGIPFAIAALALGGGAGLFSSSPHPDNLFLFLLITSIGTIVSTAVVEPFRAGVETLLYIDQRMRKEGLDIVLQQAAATPGM